MTTFNLLVIGEEESFRFVKEHLERELDSDLRRITKTLWARSQGEASSIAEEYYCLDIVVIDVEDHPTSLLFQTIQAIQAKDSGEASPSVFVHRKSDGTLSLP